jgi:hypothetical protein
MRGLDSRWVQYMQACCTVATIRMLPAVIKAEGHTWCNKPSAMVTTAALDDATSASFSSEASWSQIQQR